MQLSSAILIQMRQKHTRWKEMMALCTDGWGEAERQLGNYPYVLAIVLSSISSYTNE